MAAEEDGLPLPISSSPLPKTGGGDEGLSGALGASPNPPEMVKKQPKTLQKLIEAQEQQQLAYEMQHLQSCGKQVNSSRRTQPNFSMGSPRGNLVKSSKAQVRCREICEHPASLTPGPNCRVPELDGTPTTVLKGWGQEVRFPYDRPLATQGAAIIKHSTNASPFSTTYPYEEYMPFGEKKKPANPEEQQKEGAERSDSPKLRHNKQAHNASPRNPVTLPDYGYLHLKCRSSTSWSFGSSGLGGRFKPGTKFSRAAKTQTTTRLLGFRELREEMMSKRL
jgi:hypothetical protein